MTCAAVPSVLQNGVVVYQNVKNAHELERIPVAAPVEVGAEHERMYVGVMLQRDPQNQRLYLHDVVTEKEFTTGGNGHLNTTGPNAANGELFTADILRNALNVKSEQLSAGRSIDEMAGKCEAEAQQGCTERLVSVRDAIHRSGPERKKAIDHYTVYGGTLLIRNDTDGRSYLYDLLDVQKKKVISSTPFSAARRSGVFEPKPSANSIHTSDGNVNTEKLSTGQSIDEMAGEDADTWRGVDTGRVTQENGLFRRDAGRPTHIKRACGIASQTLLLYMYDAILRRRLTSRRRCRSDRPCCKCSGPDSRRWYSAPPPWARPRPRSRSGALPWCHRRT